MVTAAGVNAARQAGRQGLGLGVCGEGSGVGWISVRAERQASQVAVYCADAEQWLWGGAAFT